MSENNYNNLRKAVGENKRKGAFPFPTYAQALFSQVFISRTPVSGTFTNAEVKKSFAIPGNLPSTNPVEAKTGSQGESNSERNKVFSSLDKFVDEKIGASSKGEVNFPGGKITKKEDVQQGIVISLAELVDTEPAAWVDDYSMDSLTVIFVGERPKDFSEDTKDSDLLSKMISAMKLPIGSFTRVFLDSDKDLALKQWHHSLKKVSEVNNIIVVSLGAMATNLILGRKERLSRIHGQEFQLVAQSEGKESQLSIYPVFHPDILQINPNMKRSAWLDLQKVMKKLEK